MMILVMVGNSFKGEYSLTQRGTREYALRNWHKLNFYGLDCSDILRSLLAFWLLGLRREEHGVDVRENTTVSNSCVGHELVEFLIVSDGEENVSGDDSGLLVILGSISGEFENFSSKIFEDCSEVNWSSSSDSLGVSSDLEESGDSSDWELKTCLSGSGNLLGRCCLALSLAAFACSWHDWYMWVFWCLWIDFGFIFIISGVMC